MNREIRELFDKENISVRKITLKNKVRIIDTGSSRFVIKKRNKELDEMYRYLNSRSFNYFPKVIYKTDHYDVYEYVSDVDMPREERAIDVVKLLSMLHSKTTFYEYVDDDYYKELYEDTLERIEYLTNYYNDICSIIEREEFMSPSHYLFVRNVTKVFQALNYCKVNIEKWYQIISEKKRIRIVNNHNNVKLEHYLLSDKPCLVSWDRSKRDVCINDLIVMYKEYYRELDFCELLRVYELHYPLLSEERILFFVLISIPDKLEFDESEYKMSIKISNFYDYINTSEKFMSDYMGNKKEPVQS